MGNMIFFDLDGVLIDSNGVWLQVDYDFAVKRGKVVTEEYTHRMGHSIFPVAARIAKEWYDLPESPEEIMAEWRAMAYDAYAHTIPLKPGAVELLEKLKGQGEDLALLTASLPELAQAALERHGLLPYFNKGLFFAQDMEREKRDPEVYRIAAGRLGLSPAHCVLYEDAPHNCAAAQAAGFRVVGVYDHFYETVWDEVVKNSDRQVRSLTELLDKEGDPLG